MTDRTRGFQAVSANPMTAQPGVAANVFREVIGRFTTGVTVITTTVDGRDFGTTASAVTSLSLEPPMLLACLNETSETGLAIRAASSFTVNILGDTQGEIANRFATKSQHKFEGIEIVRGVRGLPLIAGSLATIQCHVAEAVRGGTHTIFIGDVEAAWAQEGSPLTYFRGQFGRFEEALQDAAYRKLRSMVLRRDLPVGEQLQPEELTHELGLEMPHLYYALTRLTSDGLVERLPGRGYAVKPLDAETADQALEARATIEMAVIAQTMASLTESDLAELRRYAESASAAVAGDRLDLQALRVCSREFHEKLVSLLDNDIFLDVYRRLGIDAIWARALAGGDGPRYINPQYLMELVEACSRRDTDAATRIIAEHMAEVRAVAARAIADVGGSM